MKYVSFPARFALRAIAGVLAVSAFGVSGVALAATNPVLAIAQEPDSLDPYNTNMTLTLAITKSFYEGLFRFDKDLKIVPVLATSYDMSKDGTVYTFKLRKGVKFQDGTDFNAEAVKANLDRAMAPENHLIRSTQFNRIIKIETPDPLTVRITLKEPFAPFINSLAHPCAAMISPTALKKYGNKEIAFHPVGTGEFELVSFDQKDGVKLKKFDGYWNKGFPKVAGVTWKPVSENATRAAMLQTGEADFAYPLPYEQAAQLKADSKLDVVTSQSIVTRFLGFNMLQKPFTDVRVRQAIALAINKPALVKVAFNGYAFPAEGIIPQGIPFAEKMAPIPYNPAKARELLKEAGYPNGFETTLWSAYTTTTARKTIEFVQQQLAQVGIKVQIEALETGKRVQLVDSWPDPATAKMRMYYTGWSSSTGEADWALRPLFASEAWSPKLNNMTYYKNELVDTDIAKALVSTDNTEKAALYKAVQDQLAKDLPRVPLVTEENVSGNTKRLHGVYAQPDGNIDIYNIAVSQ